MPHLAKNNYLMRPDRVGVHYVTQYAKRWTSERQTNGKHTHTHTQTHTNTPKPLCKYGNVTVLCNAGVHR
jgi:hypothetical protein